MSVPWLDLRLGTGGMRSPFLQENQGPYKFLDEQAVSLPRTVMLIRGREGLDGNHISLGQFGASMAIILDCALHHRQRIPTLKAGPIPSSLTLHPINGIDKLMGAADIARRLYAKFLSSMSNVVVFLEDEYEGLQPILRELAQWVFLASSSVPSHTRLRPSVLVFRSLDCGVAKSSAWFESQLTCEIIEFFDPLREHTLRTAEQAWRKQFSMLKLIQHPGKDEEVLQRILNEALEAQSHDNQAHLPFTGTQIACLFRTGCVRFSASFQAPHNLILCSRVSPGVPEPLQREIAKVLQCVARKPRLVRSASQLIASALLLDNHNQCQFSFSPDDVFNTVYRDFLQQAQSNLKPHTHFDRMVHRGFLDLAANVSEAERYSRKDFLDGETLRWAAGITTACLSCLSRFPSNRMSCGHRVCDNCIAIHQKVSQPWWQDIWVPSCTLCGRANAAGFNVKPPTAGVRALRLGGLLEDAVEMAELLRTLRSQLAGPLEDYFDLVVATGIGIFFATLIFCKGATVADCVHHLGGLRYIRAKKQEIRFGNSLRFRGDEMRTKGPKLFFQHGSFTLSPGPESGKEVDVDSEIEKLWPGSAARTVVDIQSPFRIQPSDVAGRVLVSLFYVELEEKPVFYSASPLIVTVSIKCRLQPSPHLATLLQQMRVGNVQVYFKGDEPERKADFCDDHAWNRIKQGSPFSRQCNLLVQSPTSVIDIKMDSILGQGHVPLSHSPWNLLDLAQYVGQRHKEAKAMAVLDKVTHMEDRLRQLRMS